MSIIFISDLHLDESRPDITSAFLNFLKKHCSSPKLEHEPAKHTPIEALYILGDFFEVWLGDDHHTAFNQSIIDALASIKVPIYVMHGNRDFLLGADFCQTIGATLLPDPSVLKLGNQKVLLMHGDSLCIDDQEYMQVKKMLRDPNFQSDFLSKTIDERQAFATAARAQSQAHTQASADDIMDVNAVEVIKTMETHGVQTMIHGHTHRPNVHDVTLGTGQGQRFVLGDWDKQGWYLVYESESKTCSNSKLSLQNFGISNG